MYRLGDRLWGSNMRNYEFPNFTRKREFTDHQKYTKVVQIHEIVVDIEEKGNYLYVQTLNKTFTRTL